MYEKTLLLEATPEELTKDILDGVKQIFSENKTLVYENDFLTQEQACELLDIDLSLLRRWTIQGELVSYGIGNSVYYKINEVMSAPIPLNVN